MIHFDKLKENPIYGKELGTAFDVYVIGKEGDYRMDFSWRPEKSTAVSFSKDGLSWSYPEITLAPQTESGFEDRINRNCVLFIDGKYKMWYTGQANGCSYIGYAESKDGIHFERPFTEPVLTPETFFENMSVMNPCVLYENGVYRMWYSAGETYEPNVLCYAESGDGIHWQKRKANPILVANPEKAYERDRVGGCQVVPHEKLGYLIFYIGYHDIDTACICVAASKDGKTGFRRFKGNPVVAPDTDSFDRDSCYKPSALYEKEKNRWRIYYNGRTDHVELIGAAEGFGDFAEEDFE